MSTLANIEKLPLLPHETIEAAHQLSAFIASKHQYTDNIEARTLAIIKFVAGAYRRQERPVEATKRQTSRSQTPALDYPSDWAIDIKSNFKQYSIHSKRRVKTDSRVHGRFGLT